MSEQKRPPAVRPVFNAAAFADIGVTGTEQEDVPLDMLMPGEIMRIDPPSVPPPISTATGNRPVQNLTASSMPRPIVPGVPASRPTGIEYALPEFDLVEPTEGTRPSRFNRNDLTGQLSSAAQLSTGRIEEVLPSNPLAPSITRPGQTGELMYEEQAQDPSLPTRPVRPQVSAFEAGTDEIKQFNGASRPTGNPYSTALGEEIVGQPPFAQSGRPSDVTRPRFPARALSFLFPTGTDEVLDGAQSAAPVQPAAVANTGSDSSASRLLDAAVTAYPFIQRPAENRMPLGTEEVTEAPDSNSSEFIRALNQALSSLGEEQFAEPIEFPVSAGTETKVPSLPETSPLPPVSEEQGQADNAAQTNATDDSAMNNGPENANEIIEPPAQPPAQPPNPPGPPEPPVPIPDPFSEFEKQVKQILGLQADASRDEALRLLRKLRLLFNNMVLAADQTWDACTGYPNSIKLTDEEKAVASVQSNITREEKVPEETKANTGMVVDEQEGADDEEEEEEEAKGGNGPEDEERKVLEALEQNNEEPDDPGRNRDGTPQVFDFRRLKWETDEAKVSTYFIGQEQIDEAIFISKYFRDTFIQLRRNHVAEYPEDAKAYASCATGMADDLLQMSRFKRICMTTQQTPYTVPLGSVAATFLKDRTSVTDIEDTIRVNRIRASEEFRVAPIEQIVSELIPNGLSARLAATVHRAKLQQVITMLSNQLDIQASQEYIMRTDEKNNAEFTEFIGMAVRALTQMKARRDAYYNTLRRIGDLIGVVYNPDVPFADLFLQKMEELRQQRAASSLASAIANAMIRVGLFKPNNDNASVEDTEVNKLIERMVAQLSVDEYAALQSTQLYALKSQLANHGMTVQSLETFLNTFGADSHRRVRHVNQLEAESLKMKEYTRTFVMTARAVIMSLASAVSRLQSIADSFATQVREYFLRHLSEELDRIVLETAAILDDFRAVPVGLQIRVGPDEAGELTIQLNRETAPQERRAFDLFSSNRNLFKLAATSVIPGISELKMRSDGAKVIRNLYAEILAMESKWADGLLKLADVMIGDQDEKGMADFPQKVSKSVVDTAVAIDKSVANIQNKIEQKQADLINAVIQESQRIKQGFSGKLRDIALAHSAMFELMYHDAPDMLPRETVSTVLTSFFEDVFKAFAGSDQRAVQGFMTAERVRREIGALKDRLQLANVRLQNTVSQARTEIANLRTANETRVRLLTADNRAVVDRAKYMESQGRKLEGLFKHLSAENRKAMFELSKAVNDFVIKAGGDPSLQGWFNVNAVNQIANDVLPEQVDMLNLDDERIRAGSNRITEVTALLVAAFKAFAEKYGMQDKSIKEFLQSFSRQAQKLFLGGWGNSDQFIQSIQAEISSQIPLGLQFSVPDLKSAGLVWVAVSERFMGVVSEIEKMLAGLDKQQSRVQMTALQNQLYPKLTRIAMNQVRANAKGNKAGGDEIEFDTANRNLGLQLGGGMLGAVGKPKGKGAIDAMRRAQMDVLGAFMGRPGLGDAAGPPIDFLLLKNSDAIHVVPEAVFSTRADLKYGFETLYTFMVYVAGRANRQLDSLMIPPAGINYSSTEFRILMNNVSKIKELERLHPEKWWSLQHYSVEEALRKLEGDDSKAYRQYKKLLSKEKKRRARRRKRHEQRKRMRREARKAGDEPPSKKRESRVGPSMADVMNTAFSAENPDAKLNAEELKAGPNANGSNNEQKQEADAQSVSSRSSSSSDDDDSSDFFSGDDDSEADDMSEDLDLAEHESPRPMQVEDEVTAAGLRNMAEGRFEQPVTRAARGPGSDRTLRQRAAIQADLAREAELAEQEFTAQIEGITRAFASPTPDQMRAGQVETEDMARRRRNDREQRVRQATDMLAERLRRLDTQRNGFEEFDQPFQVDARAEVEDSDYRLGDYQRRQRAMDAADDAASTTREARRRRNDDARRIEAEAKIAAINNALNIERMKAQQAAREAKRQEDVAMSMVAQLRAVTGIALNGPPYRRIDPDKFASSLYDNNPQLLNAIEQEIKSRGDPEQRLNKIVSLMLETNGMSGLGGPAERKLGDLALDSGRRNAADRQSFRFSRAVPPVGIGAQGAQNLMDQMAVQEEMGDQPMPSVKRKREGGMSWRQGQGSGRPLGTARTVLSDTKMGGMGSDANKVGKLGRLIDQKIVLVNKTLDEAEMNGKKMFDDLLDSMLAATNVPVSASQVEKARREVFNAKVRLFYEYIKPLERCTSDEQFRSLLWKYVSANTLVNIAERTRVLKMIHGKDLTLVELMSCESIYQEFADVVGAYIDLDEVKVSKSYKSIEQTKLIEAAAISHANVIEKLMVRRSPWKWERISAVEYQKRLSSKSKWPS